MRSDASTRSHAEIAEHPIPIGDGFPAAITTGTDGALWFALNQGNAIGRMTVDGAVDTFALPTPATAPVGITTGPDGAVWFVGIGASIIGRIDRNGRVTEHQLEPDARPHVIVSGNRDDLWFTEWGANRIGHIDALGAMTEIDLPTPESEPHGIALGTDGRVWVAARDRSASPSCIRSDDELADHQIVRPSQGLRSDLPSQSEMIGEVGTPVRCSMENVAGRIQRPASASRGAASPREMAVRK